MRSRGRRLAAEAEVADVEGAGPGVPAARGAEADGSALGEVTAAAFEGERRDGEAVDPDRESRRDDAELHVLPDAAAFGRDAVQLLDVEAACPPAAGLVTDARDVDAHEAIAGRDAALPA